MKTNHRRTRVRLASFALAALLVLGGFLWRSERQRAVYRNYVEAEWERAFASLSADLTEIDTAMKKLRVSSSPALMGQAAAEIWSRAEDARENLGRLPFSDWLLEDTAAWLGKVGDYALALSRSVWRGGLSPEDRGNLAALGNAAESFNRRLIELQAELDRGGLTLGRLASAEQALPAGTALLGDRMLEAEDEFPQLPTLIYDGPFSESAAPGPARALEGLPTVSEGAAIAAAADFTGLPPEAFTVLGKSEGSLPCWLLEAEGVFLRVTRQGGRVADLTSAEGAWEGELSVEEALAAARTFLSARGFGELKESYWTREEGSLLVCFHAVQDGVFCYPDLIKLRLELSEGRIIGFEGVGWLMNHRERAFSAPIPAEQAQGAVSSELTVLSRGLALIPTEGGQERFCWEFKCEDAEGRHVIVYADAADGAEVKLLLLLEDENGTLVL
ncbi:MAG: germination protein YpeB [Oscillospiraceae bacterium]|nr:germination protein YpeB [Oscillospiraceae bacterium]